MFHKKRSKHVDQTSSTICEGRNGELRSTKYVLTTDNIADIFTKPLYLRRLLRCVRHFHRFYFDCCMVL